MKEKEYLTLNDIHVGDWVQAYYEIIKRMSCPLVVKDIFVDGRLNLGFDNEIYSEFEPMKGFDKDIYGIKINEEILEGFGFVRKAYEGYEGYEWRLHYEEYSILLGLPNKVLFYKNADESYIDTLDEPFIHELQRSFYKQTGMPLKLEWKGVEHREDKD